MPFVHPADVSNIVHVIYLKYERDVSFRQKQFAREIIQQKQRENTNYVTSIFDILFRSKSIKIPRVPYFASSLNKRPLSRYSWKIDRWMVAGPTVLMDINISQTSINNIIWLKYAKLKLLSEL